MASRLQLNPASLNLVRPELARLIKLAQTEFEAALQQGAAHDLAPCREMLAQIDGVLRLIELGDAAELARTLAELLQQPLAAPRTADTAARGFFVLGRYLEYLAGRRHAVPELLLEDINALRALLSRPPLGEAQFATGEDNGSHCPDEPRLGPAIDEARLRRYRHMYQVGLLGLIRGRADPVHLRLMSQPVERMQRLVGGGPAGDFWWLLGGVLEGFSVGELGPSAARGRLLSRADRAFRDFQQKPAERAAMRLEPVLRAELLHLLAKCSGSARVAAIRAHCGLSSPGIGDRQLADERLLLLGTSADSVDSMLRVLKDDLRTVKEEVEQAAASGAMQPAAIPALLQTLERVAEVLREGGLRSSADTVSRQLAIVHGAGNSGGALPREALVAVADALVYVETTLSGLARAQGLAQSLREQQQGRADDGSRAMLDEARQSMLASAREAIEAVKVDVTRYVEGGFNPTALAAVEAQLLAVKGALQILEHVPAAAAAQRVAAAVRRAVDGATPGTVEEFAEALADVLICIEYYLAALANGEEPDPLMLKLAEESLAQLERGD